MYYLQIIQRLLVPPVAKINTSSQTMIQTAYNITLSKRRRKRKQITSPIVVDVVVSPKSIDVEERHSNTVVVEIEDEDEDDYLKERKKRKLWRKSSSGIIGGGGDSFIAVGFEYGIPKQTNRFRELLDRIHKDIQKLKSKLFGSS